MASSAMELSLHKPAMRHHRGLAEKPLPSSGLLPLARRSVVRFRVSASSAAAPPPKPKPLRGFLSEIIASTASLASPAPRVQCKNLTCLQSPLNVAAIHSSFAEKRPVLVRAAMEASEADAEQPEEPKPATKIEEMTLESKQQMIMEQRARMKLAKKLRQRRKRLVRKRRLRKKGRWPPSKMKKLKNV